MILGLATLFVWLGWTGGPTNPFDVAIVEWLTAWRLAHPGTTRAAVFLTQLGSAWATLGATTIALLWIWWRDRRRAAIGLALTVIGGRIAADSLKLLYDRPRPAFDVHPVMTSSSSYPSGHAANTMVAFVAIAIFALPSKHRRPALLVVIPLALLIAITRPFLGVHWPSDMFGGWALAAMILLGSFTLTRPWSGPGEQHHQIVGGHPDAIDRN